MNPNTPRKRKIWQIFDSLINNETIDLKMWRIDEFINLAERMDHMSEMNLFYNCDTYDLTFQPALFDVIKSSCEPNEHTLRMMYFLKTIADMNVPKSRKVNEHLLSMFQKQIRMERYNVVENNLDLLSDEIDDEGLQDRIDAWNTSQFEYDNDKSIHNEQICDDYLSEIMNYILTM